MFKPADDPRLFEEFTRFSRGASTQTVLDRNLSPDLVVEGPPHDAYAAVPEFPAILEARTIGHLASLPYLAAVPPLVTAKRGARRHVLPAHNLHTWRHLHWHLADDQGWRLEIRAFPNLTTISSRPGTRMDEHRVDGLPTRAPIWWLEIRSGGRVVCVSMDLPGDLQRLHLPAGVQHRLDELLDKQDGGTALTPTERAEAEGLVDLAELLSLPRLKAERSQP